MKKYLRGCSMKDRIKPLIKWTGSKRSQSEQILSYFPNEIENYYELFLGGGSIFLSLLSSDVNVKTYHLNDLNKNLISLWNQILTDSDRLLIEYKKLWTEFNSSDIQYRKVFYNRIRTEFNNTGDSFLFLFLNRTCYNGMIRYNKEGKFNSPCHFTRTGIIPDALDKEFKLFRAKVENINVVLYNESYDRFDNFGENDLCFLDPPYQDTKGLYFDNFDNDKFLRWLGNVNCKYLLSYDGRNDENVQITGATHRYLDSGNSSFSRLKNRKDVQVKESLWTNL